MFRKLPDGGLILLLLTLLIFVIIVTFSKVTRRKPLMDLITNERLFDNSTIIAIFLLPAIFATFVLISNRRYGQTGE